MITDWKYCLYIVVRSDLVTVPRKTALAKLFSDNGSGETEANEAKMFDSAVRLSVSGNEPVQAFGLYTPVKESMRGAIKTLIETLNTNFPGGAFVAITASIAHDNLLEGELIFTNHASGKQFEGQVVTPQNILNFLNLKVIQSN